MPPPKTNRGVSANVFLNGYQTSATTFNIIATYTQSVTTPLTAQVVDANGNIDLTKLNDPTNQYNAATELVFGIDNRSVVLDLNGNLLACQFPSETTGITFPGNWGSQNGGNLGQGTSSEVGFTDLDTVGGTYEYCLNVLIYNPKGNPSNGQTIQLDPQIVNKPSK